MIKCMHCLRYFVVDLNATVKKDYIVCPHCGELVKL